MAEDTENPAFGKGQRGGGDKDGGAAAASCNLRGHERGADGAREEVRQTKHNQEINAVNKTTWEEMTNKRQTGSVGTVLTVELADA